MRICSMMLLTGFVSACVSSSLDDAGFDEASLSNSQNAAPASNQVTEGTDLTQLRTAGANQNNLSAAPIASAQPNSIGLVDTPNQITPTIEQSYVAPNNNPSGVTTAQRQTGISVLRQKASQIGSEKPEINAQRIPATQHMSKQEQQLLRAELQAEALAASGTISDEELLLRKQKITALRRQAKSHYSSALRKIQN